MAHKSENAHRLTTEFIPISSLSSLEAVEVKKPTIYLIWFPADRTVSDADPLLFQCISSFCDRIHSHSVVCILTTPPDAALLVPHLETALRFQLWVPISIEQQSIKHKIGQLPNHHTALIVLTRYRKSLEHTKTRIGYTYCPACGKTTKDYGGKKHTYDSYGTLMADVWRDIQISPQENIHACVERLADMFGLPLYEKLQVLDAHQCIDLLPQSPPPPQELSLVPKANNIKSQLLNADCLEFLQSMPDNSIDFITLDPPYNLHKKYDHWNDSLELKDYFDWCDTWLAEAYRVLKPGCTLSP